MGLEARSGWLSAPAVMDSARVRGEGADLSLTGLGVPRSSQAPALESGRWRLPKGCEAGALGAAFSQTPALGETLGRRAAHGAVWTILLCPACPSLLRQP